MTPLAQSNLEHGQDIASSEMEYVETPVDHVEHIQQGIMAPPTAISTDQLIDPNMSLDPKFLVPIEETWLRSSSINSFVISTAIHRGQ